MDSREVGRIDIGITTNVNWEAMSVEIRNNYVVAILYLNDVYLK